MAYYINGKAFTDHPLMDEIVYNCKLILNGIVIKNDILANMSETENSINNAELLFLQTETGTDVSFDLFIFTKEILQAYGYSETVAEAYAKDKNLIPEEDRDDLVAFANEYFRNNFTEENNYYRMLNGLPPYDTDEEYYIWLTSSDIPADYNKEVDLSLPLHEQPRDLINALYVDGVIDTLRVTYPGSNYSYMNYLGEKKIDIYTARKAGKWDILYMPSVYYLIEDRFIDLYKVNREQYINRSYQDYFSEIGEYYDQMMILIVLSETFANLVTDVPQWYIRKDIFDIKSCKYFLESSGVSYFKEIPLKYQIRIVKNLNRLISNKSSNQNIDDILDIFKIDSTYIYKYWLYKEPKADGTADLSFVASGYKESYDNYIKNTRYVTPYDDIALQDKYWDAELDHDDIKEAISNIDFTIQGTKYMSVEYQIEMTKYMYQMEYMLGLILDSNTQDSLAEIRFGIPSLNETAQFKLSDIFLFLVVLTNEYYQFSSDTIFPDDMSEGAEPTINEDYYDWVKKSFSKAFVVKNGRVNGFNSELDLDELIDYIKSNRHLHLFFGNPDTVGGTPYTDDEYYDKAESWIEELGINNFVVPKYIYTIDDLLGVYNTNTKVYDTIKDALINTGNYNEKKVLEYIFQELFTRKYDLNLYEETIDGELVEYESLIDMIKDRDFVLYEIYLAVTTETNIESKRDMLRGIMNDILDTLEYYLSSDGLDYIYSFVAINSPGSIVNYLYMMLNFFKSYKVYFLDPYYTLITDDKLDNSVKAIDEFREYRLDHYKWDKALTEDALVMLNMEAYFEDYTSPKEMVDLYNYYDPDPLFDLDFDGTTAENGEIVETYDVNGGGVDTSNQPIFTANGGSAQHGVDLTNIDGGNSDDSYKNYYIIDGGEAYDPDFRRTDAMGSQKFNYMIDGGSSDKRHFISNSIDFRVVGTEFIADVKISETDDIIELLDDGLYVPSDYVASQEDFDNVSTTLQYVLDYVQQEGYRIDSDLAIFKEIKIQLVVDPDCVTPPLGIYDFGEYRETGGTVYFDVDPSTVAIGDFDFGEYDDEGNLIIDDDNVAEGDFDFGEYQIIDHSSLVYTVDMTIEETTGDMEYAVKSNTDDYYYNKLTGFTDSMINQLLNEFPEEVINPFYMTDI